MDRLVVVFYRHLKAFLFLLACFYLLVFEFIDPNIGVYAELYSLRILATLFVLILVASFNQLLRYFIILGLLISWWGRPDTISFWNRPYMWLILLTFPHRFLSVEKVVIFLTGIRNILLSKFGDVVLLSSFGLFFWWEYLHQFQIYFLGLMTLSFLLLLLNKLVGIHRWMWLSGVMLMVWVTDYLGLGIESVWFINLVISSWLVSYKWVSLSQFLLGISLLVVFILNPILAGSLLICSVMFRSVAKQDFRYSKWWWIDVSLILVASYLYWQPQVSHPWLYEIFGLAEKLIFKSHLILNG